MANNNIGGYNTSYTYNNGNYTSQINVINGVAYQKNILSIGNGCGGDNECNDGYSLYFPCTKNITRGQNICFDFFIGDNAEQDEIDMRDVEALTLELSGIYGCTYDTYVYPDDIVSLQTESFRKILFEEFSDEFTKTYRVVLSYFDETYDTNIKPNVVGEVGEFYNGDHVMLIADDTPTHIFVGWGKDIETRYDDECNEYTVYDLIVSPDKKYEFDIYEDVELYAIYRKRKKYEIKMNINNRGSYFKVITNNNDSLVDSIISDRDRNFIEILEGYEFIATCIPNSSSENIEIDDNDSDVSNDSFYYNFLYWDDNNVDNIYAMKQSRVLVADDKNPFLKGSDILLYAHCEKGSNDLNYINYVGDISEHNNFGYNEPTNHILFQGFEYKNFSNDDLIVESVGASRAYVSGNGYLLVQDGYIKTNNIDLEDGVKIELHVLPMGECKVTFELGDETYTFTYNGDSDSDSEFDDGVIEAFFRHCNYSQIIIRVEGIILIDMLNIYEEIIENKGLARLCLTPEDTLKMYTGTLYASGAITVGGNIYGIHQTIMGNINNLKPIIIKNESDTEL